MKANSVADTGARIKESEERPVQDVLLKRIINKDMTAFMYWMKGKKDKFYKIGWSYLYNHFDVEDVFQNTGLKVYENIHQLKDYRYFETWVTSIFINECKKLLRKKKRHVMTDSIKITESYQEDYSLVEFKEHLSKLEILHREVIVLKYMIGYTQDEIADIIGVPVGTIKSRIYRGLKYLRKEIDKEVR